MAKKGPHVPVPVSAQVWSYGSVCGCVNVWLRNCESVGGMVCVSGERFQSFCVYAWVLQWMCACVAQGVKCLCAPGWCVGTSVLGYLTVLL